MSCSWYLWRLLPEINWNSSKNIFICRQKCMFLYILTVKLELYQLEVLFEVFKYLIYFFFYVLLLESKDSKLFYSERRIMESLVNVICHFMWSQLEIPFTKSYFYYIKIILFYFTSITLPEKMIMALFEKDDNRL